MLITHRYLTEILGGIVSLPSEEMVEALRRAPRHVRLLLHFAYGEHELALPTTPLAVPQYMTPKSIDLGGFSEGTSLGDEDLFAAEIPKLHRLFVRGVHPTLTDEKRVALWQQIVERLPEEEADLLEHVRRFRILPARITPAVVERAFPGLLSQPVVAEAPAQGYESLPGFWTPMVDEQSQP